MREILLRSPNRLEGVIIQSPLSHNKWKLTNPKYYEGYGKILIDMIPINNEKAYTKQSLSDWDINIKQFCKRRLRGFI